MRNEFFPVLPAHRENIGIRTQVKKQIQDGKHVLLRGVVERSPPSRVHPIYVVTQFDQKYNHGNIAYGNSLAEACDGPATARLAER
jgi:hypothetical protein